MQRNVPGGKSIGKEIKKRVTTPKDKKQDYDGNTEIMISTGSTLLDLAISGGRVRGGGIPGGILVEIFGPESTGKTVLLCAIAGAVNHQGGDVMFGDPEGRLNQQFAQMFGMDIESIFYNVPDTIKEVFEPVRKWEPNDMGVINGIFADSLAALTTAMELDDNDPYGMRRAKEFSEELRKTCRVLTKNNFLMVCSNQIRENIGAGQFEQRWKTPGGKGIPFYSSLRLKTAKTGSLTRKRMIGKKERKIVYGIQIEVEVFKSSIWHPNRTAPVIINFDYGVDDIQQNLRWLKDMYGSATYNLGDQKLDKSIDDAIQIVENEDLSGALREEVINIWEDIEKEFKVERKAKNR